MDKMIENYIKENVFPLYSKNDPSHSLIHVNEVIDYSLKMGKKYNLKEEILYIISAYHDVGVSINRDIHEVISAECFKNDEFWKEKLSYDERKMIYEAIIDHRASKQKKPRNIYGKIVATADRQFDCFESAVKRTYIYLRNKYKNKNINEIYELIYRDFENRYGKNGYVKVYINQDEFEKKIKSIKLLLLDKREFIEQIKNIIDNRS